MNRRDIVTTQLCCPGSLLSSFTNTDQLQPNLMDSKKWGTPRLPCLFSNWVLATFPHTVQLSQKLKLNVTLGEESLPSDRWVPVVDKFLSPLQLHQRSNILSQTNLTNLIEMFYANVSYFKGLGIKTQTNI